jgi:hypothetical protein
MKTQSTRIPPDVAPALIAHINTYGWKITWEKLEHDSFTNFTGSSVMMERVHAFLSGFRAGQAEVENRVEKNITKLMS